jgi:hypothetical protein
MEVLPGSQPYKMTVWVEEDELNRAHKYTFSLKTSNSGTGVEMSFFQLLPRHVVIKPLKVRARAGQKVRNVRFKLYTEVRMFSVVGFTRSQLLS